MHISSSSNPLSHRGNSINGSTSSSTSSSLCVVVAHTLRVSVSIPPTAHLWGVGWWDRKAGHQEENQEL